LQEPRLIEMKKFIKSERETKNIYPDGKDIFKAFDMCTLPNTKVVILGQDPYHTPGVADGLAFSSKKGVPPSLTVIFKEIYRDMNIQYFHNCTLDEFFPTGDLSGWTRLGILLLNTALTVEEGKPGSHRDIGWSEVIKASVNALNKLNRPVVFLLWGNEAKKYEDMIDKKHMVLTAAHPAAELHDDGKGGFLGCRHFSILRDILPTLNKSDINTSVNLDSCFDKEKAIKLARDNYPMVADKIIDYINNEMIIHAPVNKEAYYNQMKEFEIGLSTKK